LLGVDTADSLRAVLARALAEGRPDALLVTGDVSHEGDEASYRRFAAIVADHYEGPVLCLPGNHDKSAAMREVLGETWALDLQEWSLIGLDSHVDGQVGAGLSETDMAALEGRLAASRGRHVLVATHHPPVDVGCPWLDKDRIQNGAELLEWLSEHAGVKGMVFGHAHQVIESAYENLALLGTPATCFQFAPRTESFAVDERKPGYRWLRLDAQGGLQTEVGRVDDYPLTLDLSERSRSAGRAPKPN
jgi:Icc protein